MVNARGWLSLLAASTCVACASTPPRTEIPHEPIAMAHADAGTRVTIPPSHAGPVPHHPDAVFSAASPSLPLSRERRVDALRDEAIASGVDPSALRIAEFAHGQITLIGWTERDPDVENEDAPASAPPSDGPPRAVHGFAWLVADDGAVLDVSDRLDTLDRDGDGFEESAAPLRAALQDVRVEGDPQHETARLVAGEMTLLFVRLAHGRITRAEGCATGRGAVVPSVCGPSVRCSEHEPWQALETSSGELRTESPCMDALAEIQHASVSAAQVLAEATDAQRHERWGEDDDSRFVLAEPALRCRRLSASARRAATRRLASMARDSFVHAGSDAGEFDPSDVTVQFGCVDRAGNALAYVANFAAYYRGIFRLGAQAPVEIFMGSPRHWMTADLTGDAIPELIFRTDGEWHVFSPSWPEGITFADGASRSGRRFVVVTDGPRAALLVEGEVRAWNGSTFVPITQGFEALRHALELENEGLRRIAALEELLTTAAPAWSSLSSAPCDDNTRITWATDVVRRLRDLGVARDDAVQLAAAPVDLARCVPTSSWGRAAAGM